MAQSTDKSELVDKEPIDKSRIRFNEDFTGIFNLLFFGYILTLISLLKESKRYLIDRRIRKYMTFYKSNETSE